MGDGRSGGSNVLRIQYAAGQPSAPLYRTSTIIAGIARDTGNAVERDPLAAAARGTVEISRRDGRVIDADSPPRHASGNRLLL